MLRGTGSVPCAIRLVIAVPTLSLRLKVALLFTVIVPAATPPMLTPLPPTVKVPALTVIAPVNELFAPPKAAVPAPILMIEATLLNLGTFAVVSPATTGFAARVTMPVV